MQLYTLSSPTEGVYYGCHMRSKVRSFLLWPKEHWKLSLFLILVLIGGGFWYQRKTAAQVKVLKFTTPVREDLTKTLQVSGKVDATEKARLRFISGGKVVYIGAHEGDTVKKWQTIATIDQAALQKQQEATLNKYMQQRNSWDQLLDDTENRTLPEKELRSKDNSQLDLNNKVIDVQLQDIAIRNTVLSAPFEGILTVSPTNVPGVQLLPADYFEIVNPKTLKFVAEVDEADIGTVQVGQQAELALDAYPDEKIPATVHSISYTSTEGSNGTVFEVTFLLNQATFSHPIRLGMNGDISIVLDTRQNVLSIPIITTRQRENKTYVDVKTGPNTATEREIKTGLETDEKYEVLDGLHDNEEIVTPE